MKAIQACLAWATESLKQTETATPQLDAECLLMAVLNYARHELSLYADQAVPLEFWLVFKQQVERRMAGEPIAYIIGQQGFWDLELRVTSNTLIPRPDTETMIEFFLSQNLEKTPLKILDLGTGAGPIALTLAKYSSLWEVWASDISVEALKIAQENAQQYQLMNTKFHLGAYYENLPEGFFDVICSNPPYLAETDPHLSGTIRYEPKGALVAGKTGLECLVTIIQEAPKYLRPSGQLLLEHGYDQSEAVLNLLSESFHSVQQFCDLNGIIRVTGGRLK